MYTEYLRQEDAFRNDDYKQEEKAYRSYHDFVRPAMQLRNRYYSRNGYAVLLPFAHDAYDHGDCLFARLSF